MLSDDDNLEEQKNNSYSKVTNTIYSTAAKPGAAGDVDCTNSSMFGDGSCGEPLVSQHLVLDFTPVEEIDNDFVQEKCCAFWDFIRSQPEFDDWLMLPESNERGTAPSISTSCRNDVSVGVQIGSGKTLKSPTAVSMLESIEGKGLVDQMFESKLAQSHCSIGSRQYGEDGRSAAKSLRTTRDGRGAACTCKGSCGRCKKPLLQVSTPSTSASEVRQMCEHMSEWDTKHPKSMEPPGHPPTLTQNII